MSEKIKFVWKKFDELSSDDLYAILHLRQQVFIVEQNCPYLDADNSDQNAFHLLGYESKKLVAYLRAFAPNIKYAGSSMGRIVVDQVKRGEDLGKKITNIGKDFLLDNYPDFEIVISAQHRLINFYNNLGFVSRGEVYLEDDIDHIQMYISPN
tara:strand:+ start:1308 stop:1766 length:459 start_codon:yes stop_codon:yes gene_type:complete